MSYKQEVSHGTCPVCDGPTKVTVEYWNDETENRREYCRNGCYSLRKYYGGSTYVRVGEDHFTTNSQAGETVVQQAVARMRNVYADRSPDERAMLEAIRKDPHDTVTRAVYSDWLEERGRDDEAHAVRSFNADVATAHAWMVNHAEECNLTFEEMIEAGHAMKRGETHCFGSDAGKDELLNDTTRAEWWKAWELITGESVDEERKQETNFRCAC